MKIALLFFLMGTFYLVAQDNTVYQLKQSIPIYSYDVPTKTKGTTAVTGQKGWLYKVDHDNGSGKIIRFLKWKNNRLRNSNFYLEPVYTQDKNGKSKKTDEKPLYFFISTSDFSNNSEEYETDVPPKWSFVTGALTVPIKIRPAGEEKDDQGNLLRPLDFSGDINVGLSVGIKRRLDSKGNTFLIPTGGINLTSISVDESAVKNNVITSKTNSSSITPFIGLILEHNNFQLAFLTGWDKLSGRTGENWIYQGKPWYGIGLGYNIFTAGTAGTPKRN